jgi:hypothetical protein
VVIRLAALPCALVEHSGRGMHAPGGERYLNVFYRHQRLSQVVCREGDAGPKGVAVRLGLYRSTLAFRMKKLGMVQPWQQGGGGG